MGKHLKMKKPNVPRKSIHCFLYSNKANTSYILLRYLFVLTLSYCSEIYK